MGAEVIEMDCELDNTFPKYNPNPEDHAMLVEMAKAVRAHGADLALGFDGDGDRCGVVDDEGVVAGGAVLAMLDRNPGKKLSELKKALPVAFTSLTLSPHCDDETKYRIVDEVSRDYQALAAAGGSILGRKIVDVITVNGARVALEDGSWVLVRASSNMPELVVVVESTSSEDDMRALFREEV